MSNLYERTVRADGATVEFWRSFCRDCGVVVDANQPALFAAESPAGLYKTSRST